MTGESRQDRGSLQSREWYHVQVRRRLVAAGIIAASFAVDSQAAFAATLTATTNPYPGITHLVYQESAIPARVHVVVVDLSSAEISLFATGESERGRKVSAFSLSSTAQVAVNGDYFSLPDFRTAGLAMGGAAAWAGAADDASSGFLRFDRNGDRSRVTISPPEVVVAVADLPAGTQGVIGGRPMLMRAGVAEVAFDCTDLIAMPCDRAPRTAVGVSADGNALYIVVVDGWQAGSLGMTAAELAGFLRDLGGVHAALMLDGGGASALYVAGEGGIVNSPSDGVERAVANHLGVRYGSLPTGQLVGFVRERDIFDDTKNISGATAELDTGQQDVTGSDGVYNFPMVTPRFACVTASAPGYRSATQCKQVVPGQIQYNSIALFPHSDFIDAAPGTPDASVFDGGVPSDAPPAASDAMGSDAGMGGGGGGCCSSGGAPGGGLAALFALTAALSMRRREPS